MQQQQAGSGPPWALGAAPAGEAGHDMQLVRQVAGVLGRQAASLVFVYMGSQ